MQACCGENNKTKLKTVITEPLYQLLKIQERGVVANRTPALFHINFKYQGIKRLLPRQVPSVFANNVSKWRPKN